MKISDQDGEEEKSTTTTICEGCYREHHFGDPQFIKSYKHCILGDSIHKEESQRICRCSTVAQIHTDGRYRNLFPVDPQDDHRGSASTKGIKCGILNLGTLVAEAKYMGMLSKYEKQVSLSDQKRINDKQEQRRLDDEALFGKLKIKGMKTAIQKSLVNESEKVAEGGESAM